jgi:hypothetical protein
MGMFKYFRDVISGKIGYYNRIKIPLDNELWKKIGDLDSPNDMIFKNFIVSAGIIIDDLMGMSKNEQTIIKIDCKKVDKEKFLQLYTVILSYFSFLFKVTNRSPKKDIKKALVKVTNRPEVVQRVFHQLNKCYSKSIGELNMGSLGGKIWDDIVEITGFGKKMDPGQVVYFIMFSGEAYKEAVKDIYKSRI